MAYLDSSGAPTKVGGGIQYMEHANRETHITFGGDRVVSPEPAPFRQPVLTKLKAVLLAGDFGGALVADCVKLQQRVSYVMGDEGNQFATPALVRVGEGGGALPGLNYWLKQLAECPRLCPVEDKVFIVCNEDNKAALAGWAEATDGARSVLDGACFPVGNLISNGCTHPSQYAGHAQDLARRIVAVAEGVLARQMALLGRIRAKKARAERAKVVATLVQVAMMGHWECSHQVRHSKR